MEKITAEQFAADAPAGWKVVDGQAQTVYPTGDFAAALALVDEIGRLAEEANHHPDLRLTYGEVRVRMMTHSEDALTDGDLALARQIAEAAASAGHEPSPDRIGAW